MNVLERFDEFIRKISKDDKIALFFDPDPDGITGGVILAKAIKRIRGKEIDLILFQEHGDLRIKDENIDRLERNGIKKVFMVDLCVDQYPEQIYKIAEFAELCIIDHHKVYKDMNSGNILHIKPQMMDEENPVAYVAAKLTYDIFSRHTDLEDLDWLAAIGIIGDAGTKRWLDFIHKVCARYKINKEKLLESRIGNAMRLIASAPEFGFEAIDECFEVVYHSRSMEGIEKSSLVNYREIISKELFKFRKDYRKNAERHDDVVFYFFKSKYKIGSTLSTRISFKEPSNTIIVIEEIVGHKYLHISFRRQDMEVKVNDLATEATKNLPEGSGGGHVPAAGGRIRKEDLEKFKENVLRIMGKE